MDPEYDSHARLFGRTHAHWSDYLQRRAHFHRNKALIESHNLAGRNEFKLGMNHFGDWSEEEFRVVRKVCD